MAPATFTVKEAVARVVDEVVTVLPAWVQVEPLLVEYQRPQVELPSVPYLACLTETVLAPVAKLKVIVTLPLFRVRTLWMPTFGSAVVLPRRASFKVQVPVGRATVPVA